MSSAAVAAASSRDVALVPLRGPALAFPTLTDAQRGLFAQWLEAVDALVAAPSRADLVWDEILDADGVKVMHATDPDSKRGVYRTVTVFDASPEDVLRVYADMKLRHKWDAQFEGARRLEHIGPTVDVVHGWNRGTRLLSGRDTCFARGFCRLEDGRYAFAMRTVAHPDAETPRKGYERAQVFCPSGFVLRSVSASPPRTEYVSMLCMHPGGWVPSGGFVKKFVAKGQPVSLGRVRALAVARSAEASAEDNAPIVLTCL